MIENLSLEEVLEHFPLEGKARRISLLEAGNIHRSYRVTLDLKSKPEFLLQRLNTQVFHDLDLLMRNIERVSSHSKRWLLEGKFKHLPQVLEFVNTKSGAPYHARPDGECYRLVKFVTNSRSFAAPQDNPQAYLAARALAEFESCLAAMDRSEVQESIAGFHDITSRIERLEQSAKADRCARLKLADAEVQFALCNRAEVVKLASIVDSYPALKRVVHGDLKFNNLLFDVSGAAPVCVVDLDTCMPGSLVYEFGDFVRSSLAPMAEDELPSSAVTLDMNRFSALCSGFMQPLSPILRPEEVQLMARAPATLALVLGARFLTDFLDGDRYFLVNGPEHNLRRARAQFALFNALIGESERFSAILHKNYKLFSASQKAE